MDGLEYFRPFILTPISLSVTATTISRTNVALSKGISPRDAMIRGHLESSIAHGAVLFAPWIAIWAGESALEELAGVPLFPGPDDLFKKSFTKILTKQERLGIFTEKLSKADGAGNVDEAISLINKTLDDVEDVYSGVKKADGIPNKDDGRMYGILDDKFVTKLEDGSVVANTKGNRILIEKDGSFKIQSRDGSKTFLEKASKNRKSK